MKIVDYIETIHDYTKSGILFYAFNPLLYADQGLKNFLNYFADKSIEKVVAIEVRGFTFAAALAYGMGLGFIPLRKPFWNYKKIPSNR